LSELEPALTTNVFTSPPCQIERAAAITGDAVAD
jgi:hypothetical protein